MNPNCSNRFTMHHNDSDAIDGEEEEEVNTNETLTVKREVNEGEEEAKATLTVKREQSISRGASPINTIIQSVSVASPLIESNHIIAPDLNIDADIDMLHNSVKFIDGNDFHDIAQDDAMLIEEPDVVQELQQEFYPTITSVTSLHPRQFNEFMNFEQKSLDSSNTKIL